MVSYDAVFTHVPFLYMYAVVGAYGSLYHQASTRRFQPFILLATLVCNAAALAGFHHSPRNGKELIQRQIWRAVCIAVFGVLLNNVHTEMFRDFHINSPAANVGLSALYLGAFLFTRARAGAPYTAPVHVLYLFVPLRRVWQVNLYVYTLAVTGTVLMIFRRVEVRALCGNAILFRPLLDCFIYLRVNEFVSVLALAQITWDFYFRPRACNLREEENMVDRLQKERADALLILRRENSEAEDSRDQAGASA